MSLFDLIGYLASILAFCTFYLKTMIRLRVVALASNVVFILYGAMGHLLPIMVLHAMLLPLNAWRLIEVKQLIRKVRANGQTGMSAPELIVPYLRSVWRSKGEAIFSKGDKADSVYYLFEGSVRLADKNIIVPQGQMIGINGIFSLEHQRTDTAVCLSDVELGVITKDKILELFYQSPDFGAFLIRMVAQRAALDNSQLVAPGRLTAAT
jgi:CRP/FNR family transcriptional regulator, cyclic AMP receptor protein